MTWNSDYEALAYLKNRGFEEVKYGIIEMPKFSQLNKKDLSAMAYLVKEWDFVFRQS